LFTAYGLEIQPDISDYFTLNPKESRMLRNPYSKATTLSCIFNISNN